MISIQEVKIDSNLMTHPIKSIIGRNKDTNQFHLRNQ